MCSSVAAHVHHNYHQLNRVCDRKLNSSCIYVHFHLSHLQLIPGVGFSQKHIGFEWGPGDMLVYETNYQLKGRKASILAQIVSSGHHLFTGTCFFSASRSAGSPFVHVVRKDEDICSPILRKLFNESHHIFVGLQKIEEDEPSKNKKPQ